MWHLPYLVMTFGSSMSPHKSHFPIVYCEPLPLPSSSLLSLTLKKYQTFIKLHTCTSVEKGKERGREGEKGREKRERGGGGGREEEGEGGEGERERRESVNGSYIILHTSIPISNNAIIFSPTF